MAIIPRVTSFIHMICIFRYGYDDTPTEEFRGGQQRVYQSYDQGMIPVDERTALNSNEDIYEKVSSDTEGNEYK